MTYQLAYLTMGADEVQRLSQDLVLDLTLDEVIALGRTVYDREMAKLPPQHAVSPDLLAVLLQYQAEHDPTRHRPSDRHCPCLACYKRQRDWCWSQKHAHAANETCPDPPRTTPQDHSDGDDPDTAPKLHPETAEDPDVPGAEAATHPGHDGPAARGRQNYRVRNATIEDFLKDRPDEEWTPT